MTGTSLDALDVCAVRAVGRGLEMRVEVVSWLSRPLGELAVRLRGLAEGKAMTAGEISRLALDFGQFHASAVGALIDEIGGAQRPALVAVHGQTVFHSPPASWQMVNPWPVWERSGCPVVSDLRGADLARGGQGAPITPMADWVMFRSAGEARVVVNLGGFCNMTSVPASPLGSGPERVRGRDVCACNHILDAAARAGLGLDFDPGGENAAKATANDAASSELVRILSEQSRGGRSLGTGDEGVAWVTRWNEKLSATELLASCTAALGEVIGSAARSLGGGDEGPPGRVILAGGGAMNATLSREIAKHAGGALVVRSDEMGVPVGMREAAQMAVLGALSMDGVAITIPEVTGVTRPAPVAGAWIGLMGAAVGARSTEVASGGGGDFSGTGDGDWQARGEHRRASDSKSVARVSDGVRSITPLLPAVALPDRSRVLSEQRNPRTAGLDEMSVLEIVRAMNAEDATVAGAVAGAAEAIAGFIAAVEERMLTYGFGEGSGLVGLVGRGVPTPAGSRCHQEPSARLIYIGAGTSGRLGVLDASECPPTFHVDPGMIVGIIAGGDSSLRRSSEGREDEREGVREEFERLGVGPADTVLGIAAGGTTPYVLGGIELARRRGALTGLLSCSPLLGGAGSSGAEHEIVVPTGPEALTGSTRLKAGTATKLVLNTITTALMVRLGKVHGNLMVDLRATNDKLRDRGARIVSALTGLDRADALNALDGAGGSVKVAAVMCLRGLPKGDAEALLERCGGRLRLALGE
jgi:N-acetylmuramic acid 6-phosphate etherase